jgi:nucleoid-associated protein YgaU
MTLQKAEIYRVDNTNEKVTCQFNPKDFTITRAIKWRKRDIEGQNKPVWEFGGGEAQELSIDLWFDTTDVDPAQDADVRKKYEKLLKMAEIDEASANTTTGKGEPPRCTFQWGSYLSFEGVIQKISQNFTMFRPDGTPVRAKVGVTFVETARPPGAQNPTTRSESRKIWIVQEGQTLDWIAYEEYGNSAHWRHIAETNNLMDPLHLHPGQVLKLVPLP